MLHPSQRNPSALTGEYDAARGFPTWAFFIASMCMPGTPGELRAEIAQVNSLAELQTLLDQKWTDPATSAIYPPGLDFTTTLPVVSYTPGFDTAFLAGLTPGVRAGGVEVRSGYVRESSVAPLARYWYGAGPQPLAVTGFQAGYDPVQWVLNRFPPPPGLTAPELELYVSERRLSRQTMAFILLAAADVPAYEAAILAQHIALPPSLSESDLALVKLEYNSSSGLFSARVHAPEDVDYLGVYETLDLLNPFPWTPLGTVLHTVDPMTFEYNPVEAENTLILANHYIDDDLDGIPDAMEDLHLGTNPEAWDSDGDGMSDYDEIYIHETDPHTAQDWDADNDSLLDPWELQNFGNLTPLPGEDPDSDGLTNLDEQTFKLNPLVNDFAGGMRTHVFQYDNANRLTGVTGRLPEDIEYDAEGNIISHQ
jgi:hypothetical protein